MDFLFPVVVLAIGVGLLLYGAELFTDAAIDAARALRITTVAMGLLLAGAEPEELLTAVFAAAKGADGIAIGDAVGTNVTILSLCLGLGAVLAPIAADRASLRHGVITLLVSLPAVGLLAYGSIGRVEGVLLVALYGLYVWYILKRERIPLELEEGSTEELAAKLKRQAKAPAWKSLGLCLIGLVMMTAGGNFTVDSAQTIARLVGVSETVIGLTLVALATSAEMLVLSIVPVLKGHPELTLGGLIGSYAYNVTLTLGAAAAVSPLSVGDEPALLSLAFMVGLLVLMLLLLRRGQIARGGGLVLLVGYALFVVLTLQGGGER
jgi:cation:H+ antiporter